MAFPTCSVMGSSGAVLTCCHTNVDPAKPSVLIALPFGVPASVAEAAFAALGARSNVLTWESRYVLDADQPFSGDERLAPIEHVQDMLCILRTFGIASCTLIGYCSGAGIALVAAREHPRVFATLLLVNGEYQLFRRGHASTDYERSIDTFLPVVASGRREASYIFSKMADVSKARHTGEQSELDRLINTPFSREEYLYRYAKSYMAYRDFDALAVAADIRQPTFVLTGRRDEHSSMENSEAVKGAIRGATGFIHSSGDHYDFCRPGSSTLEEISRHLAHIGGARTGAAEHHGQSV